MTSFIVVVYMKGKINKVSFNTLEEATAYFEEVTKGKGWLRCILLHHQELDSCLKVLDNNHTFTLIYHSSSGEECIGAFKSEEEAKRTIQSLLIAETWAGSCSSPQEIEELKAKFRIVELSE